MARVSIAVLAVLGLLAVGVAPGPAAAEDQWEDTCVGAEIIEDSRYDAVGVGHPFDVDHLRFRLQDGNYLAVTFRVLNQTPNNTFLIQSQTRFMSFAGPDGEAVATLERRENVRSVRTNGAIQEIVLTGGEISFRMYSNQDDPICFAITATETGSWALAFDRFSRTPPRLVTLDDVQALEARLERKNETIAALRGQVATLRNESISLDVTVEPAAGRQAFVAGGAALVRVPDADASLDPFRVEHRGESYRLNDAGMVTVPLEEAGRHELTVRYGAAAETVAIEVREPGATRTEAGTATTTPTERTTVPGFGPAAALLAVLLLSIAFARGRA